jgi:PIN domain nuclease of toxin-antitoxin system
MNILIDTHYLLWAFIDTDKIKKSIFGKLLLEENNVFYSQASLWEISIKYNIGKLELKGFTPEDIYSEIDNSFLKCRYFENDELVSFYKLSKLHKDPFDRIMIWQAIKSEYYFLSIDERITEYKNQGLRILS